MTVLLSQRPSNTTIRSCCCLILLQTMVSGCTVDAPWGVVGAEGTPCFPDNTCEGGLTCVNDGSGLVCIRGHGSDGSVQCDNVAAPQLDEDLPTQTDYPLVVARGTTSTSAVGVEVKGSGFVKGGSAQGGTFCVEAPLSEGSNTFDVAAVEADGCRSQSTRFEIRYSPKGTNVLRGVAATGPWDEPVRSLTDGSVSTTMQFFFTDDDEEQEVCNKFVFVTFGLSQPTRVGRVVVKYPRKSPFSHFLACWMLLSSLLEKPSDPSPQPNPAQWSMWDTGIERTSSDLVIDLPDSPRRTRTLSLLAYENGEPGDVETFEIGEVEAWTEAGRDTAERCQ